MTQPAVCMKPACTEACTTECRAAINRAWTSLRGELPPASLLAVAEPVPPSETEQLIGGHRLHQPAERHTADTITSDALDQLYREIDTLTAVCRSNKQAYIGAVKDAMAADKRTEQAEAGRDRYRLAWTSARERAQALGAGVILRVADRDFWKRQTLEQRQRAERAEAERDAATARLHELGITTANPEPSWQCPDCGGLVPASQQYLHQEAEQRARAERAEVEASEFKDSYLNACATIAAMHAAAVGRGDRGPVRGVVEDVADVRAALLQAEAAIERARALHVRNAHTGDCEDCSARDYPNYAVRWPCPTIAALNPQEPQP